MSQVHRFQPSSLLFFGMRVGRVGNERRPETYVKGARTMKMMSAKAEEDGRGLEENIRT